MKLENEAPLLSLSLSLSVFLSLIVARGYVMRPISTGFSSSVNEVYSIPRE